MGFWTGFLLGMCCGAGLAALGGVAVIAITSRIPLEDPGEGE
jgi:hypothetical protein